MATPPVTLQRKLFTVDEYEQIVRAGVLGERAIVSIQNSIRLPNSEPQPDLSILRPEMDLSVAVPAVGDVLLVIEVSDSTAAHDRTVKVPLYATSGIPETWLIDLQEQVVEVYRSPAPGRYKELQTLTGADVASPQFIPGVRLSVDEIFGAA